MKTKANKRASGKGGIPSLLHNVRTQHFSVVVQEGLPHSGLVKGRALRMSWAGFAAVRYP